MRCPTVPATPSVSVTIVTWNSRRHIGPCLESVLRQTVRPKQIVVVDNASTDGTLEALEEFADRVRIVRNGANTGFAAGQNQAIAATDSDWVLTLNPDVLLKPGFIQSLLDAAASDPRIGTVCGKLFSIRPDFSLFEEPRLDSTGIYFTPALRHLDRGWREPDGDNRYVQPEFVFGACAAAALFRRELIEDISLEDGFFDPDFFAYREDADVAWRAQLAGWRCLYAPSATAYHVRRVTPENRHSLPAFINMHSVKNRFLMRVKNITAPLYWRNLGAIMARDLMVLGGCLLREPSSLPAFWHFLRALPRAIEKRRQVMARRRVSEEYMASWFSDRPAAHRAREVAATVSSAA